MGVRSPQHVALDPGGHRMEANRCRPAENPRPRALADRRGRHRFVEPDWPRRLAGSEVSSLAARHELSSWIDRRVLDVNGDPVGVIVAICCDASSGRPAWLAIDIGDMLAMDVVVAPVRGSSLLGEDVVIAHDQQTLVTAPHVTARSVLQRADEDTLHVHYTRRPSGHNGAPLRIAPASPPGPGRRGRLLRAARRARPRSVHHEMANGVESGLMPEASLSSAPSPATRRGATKVELGAEGERGAGRSADPSAASLGR